MTPHLLHPPPSSCMLSATMLGFLMLIFSLCDALEPKTKNRTHVMSSSEGTNIMLTCEAVGNPLPVYGWTCDGENMLENTNSLNITLVNRNTTCTCTAPSILGNITKTFYVHAEPRGCPLTLTPSEIVVKFGDPILINCSTSATDVEGMGWEAPFGGTGFERPPVVTWRVEKLEEWTPSPSCYATLVDGSQCTVSPLIAVYNAPEFKNGNESKEVLQGENVTLSCSADSNPPSNIRWIYTAAVNSNVTTEGQQKTISITGITSANAGIYICVAENEAGRNTRFVSLVIKDKVPLLVIGVLLAVFAIGLIVLLVFIYYRKRKNWHSSFDIVSNATDVPLTVSSNA
ncbi:V-set and immunoglobulin domain-containing protein 10 isoform X3 [Maylandia zebra]|uniref:V-set and immunoglobulin domain-containing protein 10 isoform X3 n=1 Tax=Maylandia zebra TaxID=106582 RepID=UPI00403CE6E1